MKGVEQIVDEVAGLARAAHPNCHLTLEAIVDGEHRRGQWKLTVFSGESGEPVKVMWKDTLPGMVRWLKKIERKNRSSHCQEEV